MKKTLNFKSDETKYILENTNPNEKREPFTIEKDTMEFDTVKFYEYVFSDIDKGLDIMVDNLVPESDKVGKKCDNNFLITVIRIDHRVIRLCCVETFLWTKRMIIVYPIFQQKYARMD